MRIDEFAGLLRRQRWRVAALVAGGGLLGLLIGVVSTPVYRGAVVLAPVEDEAQGSSLLQLAGDLGRLAALPDMGGSGALRTEALATLRSRELSAQFITERNLVAELGGGGLLRRWRGREATLNTALEAWFDQVLAVSEDRRTGLVTLAVEWSDPALAADWANALVALANARLRARALNEAQRARAYLEEQLATTPQVGVQNAINRLIESNLNQAVLATVRTDYAFRVIDPAVAADPDQYVRPLRALLVLLGLALGAALAVLWLMLTTPRADPAVAR